eukprot:5262716-Pyramimonas_sp.AAC.1
MQNIRRDFFANQPPSAPELLSGFAAPLSGSSTSQLTSVEIFVLTSPPARWNWEPAVSRQP